MMTQKELSEDVLVAIKGIEHDAYNTNPSLMAISYCDSWNAVASYMDCNIEDIRLFANNDSYLLIAEKEKYIEIVDLASRTPRINIKQVVDLITGFHKPFLAYCRQTTSYPILLYMEQKEKIICFADTAEVYEDETFHQILGATRDVYEHMTGLDIEELVNTYGISEEEEREIDE